MANQRFPKGRDAYASVRRVPGLTKEHMWADWLSAYIPREREKHQETVTLVGAVRRSANNRNGDRGSACNPAYTVRLQVLQHRLDEPITGGR